MIIVIKKKKKCLSAPTTDVLVVRWEDRNLDIVKHCQTDE